jgi:hypothetical protein
MSPSAMMRIHQLGANRCEFFFDVSVHVKAWSNNPTIVGAPVNRAVVAAG